jgi:hypothetical protein
LEPTDDGQLQLTYLLFGAKQTFELNAITTPFDPSQTPAWN